MSMMSMFNLKLLLQGTSSLWISKKDIMDMGIMSIFLNHFSCQSISAFSKRRSPNACPVMVIGNLSSNGATIESLFADFP